MTDFAEALAEDRRLAILRLLHDAGGSGNESVLYRGLEMLGHTAALTRANVRADIAFLAERGCVTQEWFGDKIVVATLTARGNDVRKGRDTVAGIKRPEVGE